MINLIRKNELEIKKRKKNLKTKIQKGYQFGERVQMKKRMKF